MPLTTSCTHIPRPLLRSGKYCSVQLGFYNRCRRGTPIRPVGHKSFSEYVWRIVRCVSPRASEGDQACFMPSFRSASAPRRFLISE